MKDNKLFQGIDTVIIRVSDINFSKKWYFDKLGLTPIWDDSALKLTVMDTGSPTSLTLWQTDEKIQSNKNTATYPIFRTLDASASRNELLSNGVDVSEIIEDEVVKFFRIYDPDGNILEACEVIT